MAEVSLLVGMLANFFFYLMAIFFQSPDHLTESTYIRDGRHLSQLIQVESTFHTAYWNYIGNKSNATFRLPNVNALVPFNASHGVLAIAQDGYVWALNFDEGGDLHISKMFKVGLPPGLGKRGGIWHAAYDSVTSRLYFTILNQKDGAGIYFVDKVFSLLQQNETEEVNVTLFTKGTSLKHEFQGISVDADRRILFAAERHSYIMNGSVTVWSLRDEHMLLRAGGGKGPKELARLQSNQMFNPWDCTSYGDFLAVSEHSNSSIQIFKMLKSESDPLCKQAVHMETVAIKGPEFGKVHEPWGVSFDPAGNLLVADRGNKRIQIFHPSGNDSTTLTPVWQSDPILPAQHLKGVTAIVTATFPPSVRIVAIMFPGQLAVYR